jgi:ATP-dependent DNA helicase
VIAFLALLRQRSTKGPYLVVAPLATIPNWMKEFKKWLPDCPVLLYHGMKTEREQMRKLRMQVQKQEQNIFPIIVTSFEVAMVDRVHLQCYNWKFLVVDEGHRLKNRNCRLIKELKQLPSASRLLLTGTPIQNSLDELWSLLNFVNPMIFDSLHVFQSWFNFKNIGKDTEVGDIIGQEQNERVISKLHEILRPFLLRRMKKDVLLSMPPKTEIAVYCGTSHIQREYNRCINDGTLRDCLMSMGIEAAKEVSQTNPHMNLRKTCNHPFLFGEPRDEVSGDYIGVTNPAMLVAASGKFRLLNRMLPLLKERGHKVLIFSQMTKLLDILQDYLEWKGYAFCRIDGSVKVQDRQERIETFNSDPTMFVFLLSTRAGGLGINLQAADTVILFDSDWNPHQDSQAQDRCHRIGQEKPVVVYRLLTVDSVDIEMMEKQISKKKLDRLTISAGNFGRAGERQGESLTLKRLKDLLEDDVKNLSRMTTAAAANNANTGKNSKNSKNSKTATTVDTASTVDSTDGTVNSTGVVSDVCDVKRDISDEELEIILARTNFVSAGVGASREGKMYDVVSTAESAVALGGLF